MLRLEVEERRGFLDLCFPPGLEPRLNLSADWPVEGLGGLSYLSASSGGLLQASANQLAAGASKLGERGGELSLGSRDFGRVGSF
jgi:hypothetical protein